MQSCAAKLLVAEVRGRTGRRAQVKQKRCLKKDWGRRSDLEASEGQAREGSQLEGRRRRRRKVCSSGKQEWASLRVKAVNQDVKPITNWTVVEAEGRTAWEAVGNWPTVGSKRERRQKDKVGD
jgi:hypothetical protein